MRSLIGQKFMFYQSIKHRKTYFIVLWLENLYRKANEEAWAMYYIGINTPDIWEHSGNVENTRLWFVFSTFPSCSQMPVVFYDSVIHGSGFFLGLLIKPSTTATTTTTTTTTKYRWIQLWCHLSAYLPLLKNYSNQHHEVQHWKWWRHNERVHKRSRIEALADTEVYSAYPGYLRLQPKGSGAQHSLPQAFQRHNPSN